MADKSAKTQKRLIFKGDSFHWPDESADPRPATNLKWEVARAALRGEPVHLLDGFLIHESWRRGGQDGSYVGLFRANKAKAEKILSDLGIKGISIGRPAKADLYTWQLYPPAEGFACNITEAVHIAREARRRFSQGEPAGWDLIKRAYRAWPDARSIYQALALTGTLPEDRDEYDDLLAGIKALLERHRDDFVHALYRILSLAAENRQGITPEIADEAITPWVSEFFELKQALAVLSEGTPARHPGADRAASQFAELLKEYNEQKNYLSETAEKSAEEVPAIQNDVARMLDRLMKCDAVADSTRRAANYYEDLEYMRIRWEDVSGCLVDAIDDFSERVRNLECDDDVLYARFDKHLRMFVARSRKGQGIRDVLHSDRASAAKKKDFRQILENLPEEEDVRVHLRQLFDLTERQFGQRHGATLACGSVCPLSDRIYLQLVEEVLKIGDTKEPARWFRKTGPIAADFAAGMVYRPVKMRERLKELLVANPACLLEGDAATGKTVLVRDLILELREEIGDAIYHFSCHHPDGFDTGMLLAQIRCVKGIVVVEDIHLCPQKAQQVHSLLYSWLKSDSNNHILFTGRPSFKEGQKVRLAPDMSSLPTLQLTPFLDAGSIIEQYIAYQAIHKPDLLWSEDAIREIKARTDHDYWLLAYALDGYVEAEGKGKFGSWIGTGVREDLRDLANSGDPSAARYPEIVVALSLLYREEVMTAKEYLTDKNKCGFDSAAFHALVVRGEITREVTPAGHIFYGLPHSSLANAYWEHGREYVVGDLRRSDADWLCDYALFNVSNPVRAILTGNNGLIRSCLLEIYSRGRLTDVLAHEDSLDAIGDILTYIGDSSGGLPSDAVSAPSMLDMIADKASCSTDLTAVGDCFLEIAHANKSAGEQLWAQLRARGFPPCVETLADLRGFNYCIQQFNLVDHVAAFDLCEHLDIHRMAKILSTEGCACDCNSCITTLSYANYDMSRDLIDLLDVHMLGRRLPEAPWPGECCECIYTLNKFHPVVARKICDHLDLTLLATRLVETDGMWIPRCMVVFQEIAPDTAVRLCQRLDIPRLAEKLFPLRGPFEVAAFVAVAKTAPDVGEQLGQLIEKKFRARRKSRK